MAGKRKIIVGARGSLLSRAQTDIVISALKKKSPGYKFIFKKIITAGDRNKTRQKEAVGIFVKKIEGALLSGQIDIAIHSAKDLPSELPAGLKLAAVPKRESPADVLIAREKISLREIKPRAVIGTSSPRRRAQLLNLRPDLSIKDLRGNLDTRIKKLETGEFTAIISALAGIKRLKIKNLFYQILPNNIMLPCAGQGALAIEIRKKDKFIKGIVSKINHPPSFTRVSCERAFIQELRAGCRLPVGALARIKGKRISLEAKVLSPDGKKVIYLKKSASVSKAESLGRALAKEALKKGAGEILESKK
ncbi:MAG TPA: hydroxymethylbilane synthase [Candidatus Omnitrophota bacterium]|nr:hydroxymethylbilane synthase [Candidatus Omnitrophota bacterium]